MEFLQPRDRGKWWQGKYVRITPRIESIDTIVRCGSFTARLLISSEQSENTLVQRLDLSRQESTKPGEFWS